MIREVKLGEICNILNGYAFKSKEYVEDGIRIIRITNVQKGIIQDTDPKYYKIDKIETLKNYMLKENDLLISLTGNVGRVGQISKELLPAGLNQRVGCIRIKEKKDVSIDYLYQYFNSYNFERDCINNSKGIAQKNLSTEWLKNYKMKIPSLDEQKRIAIELKHIQRIKDLKQQQLKELDQLIKSQFVEMFGIPFLNDKNWKHGIIKDLVREVKYGTSKPANGGKYKYLRMNNITYDGKLDLREIKYIDIEESDKEKYSTKNGDILFNRTNSKELVGKTCVFDIEEEMIIAGFIIRVRINEFANPYFISEYMNTVYLKEKLRNMCKDASGQSNINAKELENIKIYIPPITLQNQFSEIVKQIDKQKFESMIQLKMMEKIYNIINDRRRYV